MPTLKETAEQIAKSNRLKKALFDEEATQVDLLSIFVDFGLAVFEATKESCARSYGSNRFGNSTDIKRFIREIEFPKRINMQIK